MTLVTGLEKTGKSLPRRDEDEHVHSPRTHRRSQGPWGVLVSVGLGWKPGVAAGEAGEERSLGEAVCAQ